MSLNTFPLTVNAKSIILGDDECTFGPSYWCKDLHTAKHCNAVKYCAEKVWLKHLKVINSCFRITNVKDC